MSRRLPRSVPWVQAEPPWIPHGERAKEYDAEDSLPVPLCADCDGEIYYEFGAWWPEGCRPVIAVRSNGGYRYE